MKSLLGQFLERDRDLLLLKMKAEKGRNKSLRKFICKENTCLDAIMQAKIKWHGFVRQFNYTPSIKSCETPHLIIFSTVCPAHAK